MAPTVTSLTGELMQPNRRFVYSRSSARRPKSVKRWNIMRNILVYIQQHIALEIVVFAVRLALLFFDGSRTVVGNNDAAGTYFLGTLPTFRARVGYSKWLQLCAMATTLTYIQTHRHEHTAREGAPMWWGKTEKRSCLGVWVRTWVGNLPRPIR